MLSQHANMASNNIEGTLFLSENAVRYQQCRQIYNLAFAYITTEKNSQDHVKFVEHARLLNTATTFINEYENIRFKVRMDKAQKVEIARTYAEVVSSK